MNSGLTLHCLASAVYTRKRARPPDGSLETSSSRKNLRKPSLLPTKQNRYDMMRNSHVSHPFSVKRLTQALRHPSTSPSLLPRTPYTPHAHHHVCYAENGKSHLCETMKQTITKSKDNAHLRHRSFNLNARTVACLHFQFHAKSPDLSRHVPTCDVIIWSRAYHFRLQ